jgi:hypothetical protein
MVEMAKKEEKEWQKGEIFDFFTNESEKAIYS